MKSIALLCLLICSPSILEAQTDTCTYTPGDGSAIRQTQYSIEPGLVLGFPAGNFHDELGHYLLLGPDFGVFYQSRAFPLAFGLRFTGFTYDRVAWDINDNNARITKCHIRLWQGVVRYEVPLTPPLALYMEGMFGPRRFLTKSYTRETGLLWWVDDGSDTYRDRKKHLSDWNFSWGGALGLYIYLKESSASMVFLQAGFVYSPPGGFYVETGLRPVMEDPLSNYRLHHAPLSIVTFRFGVKGVIGK